MNIIKIFTSVLICLNIIILYSCNSNLLGNPTVKVNNKTIDLWDDNPKIENYKPTKNAIKCKIIDLKANVAHKSSSTILQYVRNVDKNNSDTVFIKFKNFHDLSNNIDASIFYVENFSNTMLFVTKTGNIFYFD